MRDEKMDGNLGISRRLLLKRGAVVGGSLVWATPAVQSFARPALAAGSCDCEMEVKTVMFGQTVVFNCELTAASCRCLCDNGGDPEGCGPLQMNGCHAAA